MDQCDTIHMLYLLQCACELHRKRVIERNKYFESISRTDRYLSHVDTPQIITNFIEWHNEDRVNHVFTGETIKTNMEMVVINDLIWSVGAVKKGEAVRIYEKLIKEVKIQLDEWTSKGGVKLRLETWGLTRFYVNEKLLQDCSVEDVILLFTFEPDLEEEQKIEEQSQVKKYKVLIIEHYDF